MQADIKSKSKVDQRSEITRGSLALVEAPDTEDTGMAPVFFLLQTTTRQTVVRMAMTAHPTAMVMRMPIRGTLELLVLDHLDTAKTNQSLEN